MYHFNRLPNIIFAQPHQVSGLEVLGNYIVVIDIAFALPTLPGEYPLCHPHARKYYEKELEKTTFSFIHKLGSRLLLWIDHHDHSGWHRFKGNRRFHLVSTSQAPACMVLVDKTLFKEPGMSMVDCIVSHGDLDGILSTSRFLLGGNLPYPEALSDAITADTRYGNLSKQGELLDQALKVSTDNSVRHAAIRWLVWQDKSAGELIQGTAGRYEALKNKSQRLAALGRPVGRSLIADARECREPFDLTQTLHLLQAKNRAGIVIHRLENCDYIAVAWKKSQEPLPQIFSLPGGSPYRVRCNAKHLYEVTEKLNNASGSKSNDSPCQFPKQAMVEIVRRCNLKCALCPVGNGKARQMPDMSQEIFRCIIDSFGSFLDSITLHNYGEPLLHPLIAEFINYARNSGVKYMDLNTNGHYLTPKLAKKLILSGLNKIRFSIDTADPEAYRIYRRDGNPKQVLKNIKLMKEIRTAVGSKTPLIEAQALLMKQNEQNIREFKEVLLKTGVDAIRMKTLNVFMSGESPENEDRDFLPQNPAFLRYETHEPLPAGQTDKLLLCRWPWDRLIVLADGTITPCCHDFNGNFPLGRVIPNTAGEMWDTPQRRQFMVRRILEPRTIPMCRRCSSAVPSHSLRKAVNIDKNRE